MQTLFLWTGNIYILWSVRASSLLCLSHKTRVFIGSTVRQKYEFPPVYVLQLADGEQFPKDDALCQPVSDQGLFWIVFFSTQMKWRHTCCPQHVPSSVSAFSCSVFLSEGYCSLCWSPEVPMEGNMVLHERCNKCQWKICISNKKPLKGNTPSLLLLPKPFWLWF